MLKFKYCLEGSHRGPRSIDSNECLARFYKVKHFMDDNPKSFTRARKRLRSPYLRENSIRTIGACCWAIYKYVFI